jgi:hypothetical protein
MRRSELNRQLAYLRKDEKEPHFCCIWTERRLRVYNCMSFPLMLIWKYGWWLALWILLAIGAALLRMINWFYVCCCMNDWDRLDQDDDGDLRTNVPNSQGEDILTTGSFASVDPGSTIINASPSRRSNNRCCSQLQLYCSCCCCCSKDHRRSPKSHGIADNSLRTPLFDDVHSSGDSDTSMRPVAARDTSFRDATPANTSTCSAIRRFCNCCSNTCRRCRPWLTTTTRWRRCCTQCSKRSHKIDMETEARRILQRYRAPIFEAHRGRQLYELLQYQSVAPVVRTKQLEEQPVTPSDPLVAPSRLSVNSVPDYRRQSVSQRSRRGSSVLGHISRSVSQIWNRDRGYSHRSSIAYDNSVNESVDGDTNAAQLALTQPIENVPPYDPRQASWLIHPSYHTAVAQYEFLSSSSGDFEYLRSIKHQIFCLSEEEVCTFPFVALPNFNMSCSCVL